MSALARYYRAKHERFVELLHWRDELPALLEAVKTTLPDAEVYVFGSALRNELAANSDIDVLVVSDMIRDSERHKLAVRMEGKLKEPMIFELHLTNREGLSWYKRHAKELVSAQLVRRKK